MGSEGFGRIARAAPDLGRFYVRRSISKYAVTIVLQVLAFMMAFELIVRWSFTVLRQL